MSTLPGYYLDGVETLGAGPSAGVWSEVDDVSCRALELGDVEMWKAGVRARNVGKVAKPCTLSEELIEWMNLEMGVQEATRVLDIIRPQL